MRQTGFELPHDLVLPDDAVFIGLAGSHIYNLNHEHSDMDIFVFTRETVLPQQFGEEFDVTVDTWKHFLERALNCQINECDMVFSGRILIIDESFRPLIENLAFNKARLYNNIVGFAEKLLFSSLLHPQKTRSHKSIKVVIRSLILLRKLATGEYSPYLNNNDRELLFSMYHETMNKYANPQEVLALLEQEFHISSIFEFPTDNLAISITTEEEIIRYQ